MKATTVLFLLLTVCNVSAQTGTAPSADVAISISEGTPEYCVGEGASALLLNRGPDDDITLRLPLKVLYENHRSETIILPPWSHYLTRMTVDGQNGSTVLRNATRGIDVKGVMALSSPDSLFAIIPGGKYAWSTGLEWVLIPVRHLPSGLDLRGKTVQIVMTRDFLGLAPDVVDKLNEKWKDYGTVWAGVAESNIVTFYIPKEPLTRGTCNTSAAR